MDEYISREAVNNLIEDMRNNRLLLVCERTNLYILKSKVAKLPAADVQPIKKGHWYHNTSKYISALDAYFIQACCSCCGKYSDRVDSYSTIMSNEMCSHCGARMNGDAE